MTGSGPVGPSTASSDDNKPPTRDIWACDFLPVTDLLFRPLYAFFVIALGSRRVVHVGVTRQPTDVWVAQQLREATPFGQRPTFLLHDNDSKYGPAFTRVAEATGIKALRTRPRQRLGEHMLVIPMADRW